MDNFLNIVRASSKKLQCLVFMYIIRILVIRAVACVNILDKYPPGLKKLDLLTCRNRCGLEEFVCSCKARCRAYRNCCEDFKEECPNEFKDTEKISHVLNHLAICHRSILIFMIASCDTNSYSDTSPANLETTFTSPVTWTEVPYNTTETKSNPEWGSMLLTFNASRPVLDLYSGLFFSNYEIFTCNSVKQSVPVVLDAVVGMLSEATFPNIPALLQSIARRERDVIYTLPSFVNGNEFQVPCIVDSISSCFEKNSYQLFKRCIGFVSYVASKNDNEDTYFNNIHCMECYNSSYHIDKLVIKHPTPKRHLHLAALMSFTADAVVFNSGDSKTNWQEMVCPYLYTVGEKQAATSCRVTQCKDERFKDSGGSCSYKRKLRIAVDNGDFPLTPYQIERLPSLYACLLETHTLSMDISVDDDQRNVIKASRTYDFVLDKTLFYFEINVMSQFYAYHFPDSAMARSLHVLNNAVYTNTRQKFRENEVISGNNNRFEDGSGHESSHCDLSNLENLTTSLPTQTVVCACMTEHNARRSCQPSCKHGARSDFCETIKMEKIVSSKCFDKFYPSKSSVTKLSVMLSGQMLAITVYSF